MYRSPLQIAALTAMLIAPMTAAAEHRHERDRLRYAVRQLDESAHMFEELACARGVSPYLTKHARIFLKKVHRLRESVKCNASMYEMQANVHALRNSVRAINHNLAYAHVGPRLYRTWDCTVTDFRQVARTIRSMAAAPPCGKCHLHRRAGCKDGRCLTPAAPGIGLHIDLGPRTAAPRGFTEQLPRRGTGPRGRLHADVGPPIGPPAVLHDRRSASQSQLLHMLLTALMR